MAEQPQPPIFVLTEGDDRFPLIFVAADQGQLDDYFAEHAEATPDTEAGTIVTSRFVDLTGKRWSHEGGGSRELVPGPTEANLSQQSLRDTVIRGYMELVRFYLEAQDLEHTAIDIANQRNFAVSGAPPPNYGTERHVAWHLAKHIPLNRSH